MGMEDFMSEIIMIEENAVTTSSQDARSVTNVASSANVATTEAVVMDIEDVISDDVAGEVLDETIDNEAVDYGEVDNIEETEGLLEEDGFTEDSIDGILEDDMIIDPAFDEGAYMDPGFYEEGFMEPGMEMGMAEVKDPLLSSWPFVIGISAAVFVVSVALGAFLARLKIKKGIDLYED